VALWCGLGSAPELSVNSCRERFPHHEGAGSLEDVCYRLEKAAFLKILQHFREIGDGMSHPLMDRKLKLDTIREGLTQSAMRERAATTQQALLRRIRAFFTLR
jgi:hypothetical protein